MKYTFFNTGNYYFFKPFDKMYFPDRKEPILAINYYKDVVRSCNNASIYILDDQGKELIVQ